jgi:ADP-ribose pyrophosphatase
LDWCSDGTITDAKTLIGLYRTQAYLKSVVELMQEDPGC